MHVRFEALECDVVLVLGLGRIVDGVAGQSYRLAYLVAKVVRLVQQLVGGRSVRHFATGAGPSLLEGELDEFEQMPEVRFALRPDCQRFGDVQALRVRTYKRMWDDRFKNDGLWIHREIMIFVPERV